ncbi:DUF2189 domain-containing protein [Rhodoferax sp.]|uniref:DUF2189 domain-containing protein n=1 Tax=Rhodoferax sp. TaxID=50421 RepID=UPI00261C799B|nr:DUF2189 domain-containing protein [Rhodoferax sp.]MDD3935392.1 DUF2189 domain-containing protein [Rhodoferax sp.]
MLNPPPPANNPAFSSARDIVRTVDAGQPLRWLVRAWHDVTRCGWISVLHGVAIALAGALMLWVAHDRFWFLAGAFSGFLLVGPVLVTSLYALSRGLERGEKAGFSKVLETWLNWKHGRIQPWGEAQWQLVRFGVLLALGGTVWVLISAALITWLAPVPITSPLVFVEQVVLAKEGWLFEAWLVLGGSLVAPIFASTVITIPFLLDRQVGIGQAIAASWRVVLGNPVPMAFWGAILMVLTFVGFATALTGLVLLVPLLGHASWHAYRDLLDASALPERE